MWIFSLLKLLQKRNASLMRPPGEIPAQDYFLLLRPQPHSTTSPVSQPATWLLLLGMLASVLQLLKGLCQPSTLLWDFTQDISSAWNTIVPLLSDLSSHIRTHIAPSFLLSTCVYAHTYAHARAHTHNTHTCIVHLILLSPSFHP